MMRSSLPAIFESFYISWPAHSHIERLTGSRSWPSFLLLFCCLLGPSRVPSGSLWGALGALWVPFGAL